MLVLTVVNLAMEVKGVKPEDYFVVVYYDKEKTWESKVIQKKTTFEEAGRILYDVDFFFPITELMPLTVLFVSLGNHHPTTKSFVLC